MAENFEERQLDRANNIIAGRCEHCGVTDGAIHKDLCVITLSNKIIELEVYVQRLRSAAYNYDNLARKFDEISSTIRSINSTFY